MLHEIALVSKFTSLWFSPHLVHEWITQHWESNIQNLVIGYACNLEFYIFILVVKKREI